MTPRLSSLGPPARIVSYLPPDVGERLTTVARREGLTVAAFVRALLLAYDRGDLRRTVA